MDLKNLKTFTDRLDQRDIAMFHHCLNLEWTRLNDFRDSLERGFKPYQSPTLTFNSNVDNRSNLLIHEVKMELQYLENLIHYTREFFDNLEHTEYHVTTPNDEVNTTHINNTI